MLGGNKQPPPLLTELSPLLLFHVPRVSFIYIFTRKHFGLYIWNRGADRSSETQGIANRGRKREREREREREKGVGNVSLCRSLAYFLPPEEYRGYRAGDGEIASSKLCSYGNSVVNLPTERVAAVSNYRMDFDSLGPDPLPSQRASGIDTSLKRRRSRGSISKFFWDALHPEEEAASREPPPPEAISRRIFRRWRSPSLADVNQAQRFKGRPAKIAVTAIGDAD